MSKIAIKNEKLFKSKTQMVIYTLLFVLIISLFIYLGNKDYTQDVDDNIKFAQEFNIDDKDNIFKYTNHSQVYNIVNGNTGIVLMGHKNNVWLPYYAEIVNKVAKEVGIEQVFYYDFLDDRNDNNGTYEAIVNKLASYVTYNDVSEAELYSPTLIVVVGDEIIFYDDDTAVMKGNISPEQYWNSFNTGLKEEQLTVVFNEFIESSGK